LIKSKREEKEKQIMKLKGEWLEEIKKSGEVIMHKDALELLRKTWFEMGYRAGLFTKNTGERESLSQDIEKSYVKVRGQYE